MKSYVLTSPDTLSGPARQYPGVTVSKSLIASVDKVSRLRFFVSGRLDGLRYQFINVLRSPLFFREVFERDVARLESILYRLDQNERSKCHVRGPVNNAIIIKSVYKELFKEWKTFPASIEAHSMCLFGSFTKKKFDYTKKLRELKFSYNSAVCNGSTDKFLSVLKARLSDEQFFVDSIQDFIEKLKACSLLGRRAELMRRLAIEIEYRYSQGWYFVFNTLTVDNRHMSVVFPKDGKSGSGWREYIRYCDRFFGVGSFGSFDEAIKCRKAGNDFHVYFAVVEKGSLSGRLHIHVLHMIRDLPSKFSDPNLGRAIPNLREISFMKSFWNYGFSTPIAVRFCAQDAFGMKGWRWPAVSKGGFVAPLVSRSFERLVGYIGKYISKDIDKERGCIWRTRLSRRLGVNPIQSRIRQLPLKSKMEMLRAPNLLLDLGQSRVPKMLFKRLIMKSLPVPILRSLYRKVSLIRTRNLISHFRALIQGTVVYNRLSFGNTEIMTLRMEAVFSLFKAGSYTYCPQGPIYAV